MVNTPIRTPDTCESSVREVLEECPRSIPGVSGGVPQAGLDGLCGAVVLPERGAEIHSCKDKEDEEASEQPEFDGGGPAFV